MDAASALLGASRRLSMNTPQQNGSQGESSWGAPPTSPGAGSSNSWTTTSESSSSPNSGQWNSGSERGVGMNTDGKDTPPTTSGWFGRLRTASESSSCYSSGTVVDMPEGDDKAGNLPSRENMSWFGWKPRQRANSEGQPCFSGVKIQKKDIANWLATQESGNSWLANGRIRRSSSRDIEEAMSGGLPKADLYMPPI
jgi:hypothetical protein